ncbi:MAG TPA: 16S rRNA methyltransferase [Pyrodictium sp.]|nr:16S rRNA methyltransferase [Pyrodictium sp.]
MKNKERLKLVLAEAALELVPRELWGHPSVYKSAWKRGKSPGQILLDRSLHHQAMQRLPKAEKRGRPDIVHFCLLEALDSPLNREGLLEIYVHTFGDYVVWVNPQTRLPRNYNRFVGLMEQLFEAGRVPPNSDKPLMIVKPMKLETLVRRLSPNRVILLSETGETKRVRTIAEEIVEDMDKTMVIIGAFPHGDFEPSTYKLATHIYSIYRGRSLEAWVVVSHLLALLADTLRII